MGNETDELKSEAQGDLEKEVKANFKKRVSEWYCHIQKLKKEVATAVATYDKLDYDAFKEDYFQNKGDTYS